MDVDEAWRNEIAETDLAPYKTIDAKFRIQDYRLQISKAAKGN